MFKKGNKLRKGLKPKNAFPKGSIPWNKGIPCPEETKKKIGKANKGKKRTEEFKRRISERNKRLGIKPPSAKGKHLSEEQRKAISKRMKGSHLSEETKMKLSKANKGKHRSDDVRRKISEAEKGRHPSEETRRKISKTLTGRHRPAEVVKRISKALQGRHHSDEAKEKIREAVIEYIKENRGRLTTNVGKHEKQILDELEIKLGYRIIRQYQVGGYFLDGYIPEINLAIEVDEKYHKRERQRKKDAEREEFIKQKLGCRFMRIKDY